MSNEPDRRLEDAFRAYMSSVQQTWDDLRNETVSGPRLLLMRSDAEILSAAVKTAERSSQFDQLCSATIDWRAAIKGEPLHIEIREMAVEKLRCWLRHSRTYQAVSREAPVDLQAMVSRLMQDLAAERQQIRHFVPIPNVKFSRNMEGSAFFRIVKLDEGELDLAIRNDVNRLFYPHAVVDTRSLSNCRLLEVTESLIAPGFEEDLVFGTEADFDASGFPGPVETALESICYTDGSAWPSQTTVLRLPW